MLHGVRCLITITPDQHPRAPRLLKNIEKYGLQKHIVNVGRLKQEELGAYFYNSDALFFPTPLESFSGTYLEAMHFGIPVIAYKEAAVPETLGDAGILVRKKDSGMIAEMANLLFEDAAFREKIVSGGEKRLQFFSKEKMGERLKGFLSAWI